MKEVKGLFYIMLGRGYFLEDERSLRKKERKGHVTAAIYISGMATESIDTSPFNKLSRLRLFASSTSPVLAGHYYLSLTFYEVKVDSRVNWEIQSTKQCAATPALCSSIIFSASARCRIYSYNFFYTCL